MRVSKERDLHVSTRRRRIGPTEGTSRGGGGGLDGGPSASADRERERPSEATRQSGASTQMAVFPAAEWATDDRTATGVAPGRINRSVRAGDGVKLAAARLFIGERRRER